MAQTEPFLNSTLEIAIAGQQMRGQLGEVWLMAHKQSAVELIRAHLQKDFSVAALTRSECLAGRERFDDLNAML